MKHLWVEMRVISVDLIPDPNSPGNIAVMVSDSQLEFASEDAEHACWTCGTNPTIANLNDECSGEKPPV
jgi:hypothetical protein